MGTAIHNADVATEWTDGSIINLKGLSGSTFSQAVGIKDAEQIVGFSAGPTLAPAPERSTCAMLLVGFPGWSLLAIAELMWRDARLRTVCKQDYR